MNKEGEQSSEEKSKETERNREKKERKRQGGHRSTESYLESACPDSTVFVIRFFIF